jgi:hypothetical protein
MLWTFMPGDPAGNGEEDDLDRIVIDGLDGEDLGMSYVSDVAVWYAEQNIRHGYRFSVQGHCFKGPYAIMYDRIEIVFEACDAPARLRAHLHEAWGPEDEQLGEVGEARKARIE